MSKPLVYLAGPITHPEPMGNTHRAVKVATALRDGGLVTPFVPHLTCLWHLIDPASYETWLEYDFDIIERCDAVYRMPGASKGADRETVFAVDLGLPVFYDERPLLEWAAAQ